MMSAFGFVGHRQRNRCILGAPFSQSLKMLVGWESNNNLPPSYPGRKLFNDLLI